MPRIIAIRSSGAIAAAAATSSGARLRRGRRRGGGAADLRQHRRRVEPSCRAAAWMRLDHLRPPGRVGRASRQQPAPAVQGRLMVARLEIGPAQIEIGPRVARLDLGQPAEQALRLGRHHAAGRRRSSASPSPPTRTRIVGRERQRAGGTPRRQPGALPSTAARAAEHQPALEIVRRRGEAGLQAVRPSAGRRAGRDLAGGSCRDARGWSGRPRRAEHARRASRARVGTSNAAASSDAAPPAPASTGGGSTGRPPAAAAARSRAVPRAPPRRGSGRARGRARPRPAGRDRPRARSARAARPAGGGTPATARASTAIAVEHREGGEEHGSCAAQAPASSPSSRRSRSRSARVELRRRRRPPRRGRGNRPTQQPAAGQQHHGRTEPQQPGGRLHRRLEQDEVAVALGDVGEHLRVAVAGDQPVAHQPAQVAGEVGIGIVDRLVLADEAAQLLARACAPAPPAPGPAASRPGRSPPAPVPASRQQQQERGGSLAAARAAGRMVSVEIARLQRPDMAVGDAAVLVDHVGLRHAVDAPVDRRPGRRGRHPGAGRDRRARRARPCASSGRSL